MRNYNWLLVAYFGIFFEFVDLYLFHVCLLSLNISFFNSPTHHFLFLIPVILSLGYLSRVLGAVLFGYLGDNLGGMVSFRRALIIMAISTLMIGFLPSYHLIGILSIVYLMIFRFFQSLSFEGVRVGGGIMLLESYGGTKEIALLLFMIVSVLGFLFAKFIYFAIALLLRKYTPFGMDILNFGWRMIYMACGVLTLFICYRRKMVVNCSDHHSNVYSSGPISHLFKMIYDYKTILLLSMFCLSGVDSYLGVVLVYLPDSIKFNFPEMAISHIYYISTIGLLLGCGFGIFISRFSCNESAYNYGIVSALIISLLLYYGLDNYIYISDSSFLVLLFMLSFSIGIPYFLSLMLFVERVSHNFRYTIILSSFSLASLFFIGIPKCIFFFFPNLESIRIYFLNFMIASILQLISMSLFKKRVC